MHVDDLWRVELAAPTAVQYYGGQVAFLPQFRRQPAAFAADYFHSRQRGPGAGQPESACRRCASPKRFGPPMPA